MQSGASAALPLGTGPLVPLPANEERFRHLVEATPALTWSTDREGNVTYANKRLLDYTGLEGRTALDWSRESVHPEDYPQCAEAWHKAREDGDAYEIELRLRRHDGVYRWFLVRVVPLKDADGRVAEWFGSGADIDSRKRSEDTLRFLAEVSVALGTLTDFDATLARVANLAVPYFCDFCEVTVIEASDTVRTVATSHGDPEQERRTEEIKRRFPRVREGAAGVLRTGEAIWIPEVDAALLDRVASSTEHLELLRGLGLRSFICVPMRSQGRILGAISFATAKSGRTYSAFDRRVAEELASRAAIAIENSELLRALRETDQRKDEFLAVLAHELRNPLAPVRNAIEILRASHSPSPQLQWTHDVIDRQVRQMTRLVDDLLDVSRISSGKIELRKERVELSSAVRIALEACRPLIERGGHELTVRIPREPIWLDADLARIAQILSNLLNNAAKYTRPGGHIWLDAERSAGVAMVRVRDNGVGIAPEMLESIFEMFMQAGGRIDHSQGGLGIGLTLVKRLAELHGGRVQAKSAGIGMGSEFVLCLPLASQDGATADSGAHETANDPRIEGRRVLVVDDNRDAADSLSMLLEARGHEVRVAYDGLEAVGAAVAFQPDVVLLDIGLPKLYGYDAARRIRDARGAEVLLVAITGWGQDEDRRRAKDAGFDYHLTKPVDPEAINRLIDGAARKR
jgi:PAS domain S-box-containing protein